MRVDFPTNGSEPPFFKAPVYQLKATFPNQYEQVCLLDVVRFLGQGVVSSQKKKLELLISFTDKVRDNKYMDFTNMTHIRCKAWLKAIVTATGIHCVARVEGMPMNLCEHISHE